MTYGLNIQVQPLEEDITIPERDQAPMFLSETDILEWQFHITRECTLRMRFEYREPGTMQQGLVCIKTNMIPTGKGLEHLAATVENESRELLQEVAEACVPCAESRTCSHSDCRKARTAKRLLAQRGLLDLTRGT